MGEPGTLPTAPFAPPRGDDGPGVTISSVRSVGACDGACDADCVARWDANAEGTRLIASRLRPTSGVPGTDTDGDTDTDAAAEAMKLIERGQRGRGEASVQVSLSLRRRAVRCGEAMLSCSALLLVQLLHDETAPTNAAEPTRSELEEVGPEEKKEAPHCSDENE